MGVRTSVPFTQTAPRSSSMNTSRKVAASTCSTFRTPQTGPLSSPQPSLPPSPRPRSSRVRATSSPSSELTHLLLSGRFVHVVAVDRLTAAVRPGGPESALEPSPNDTRGVEEVAHVRPAHRHGCPPGAVVVRGVRVTYYRTAGNRARDV